MGKEKLVTSPSALTATRQLMPLEKVVTPPHLGLEKVVTAIGRPALLSGGKNGYTPPLRRRYLSSGHSLWRAAKPLTTF